MFEERSIKLDLFALVLLGATIFVTLALVTYNRADTTSASAEGVLVYPAPGETANLCGRAGSWLADGLLRLLGVGSYYVVVSLAILTALLLSRREITFPKMRGVGWFVSLIGIATLCGMLIPQVAPALWRGPVIGPGGVLGTAGRALLEMHFATVGAYILTISVIFGGLLLCTDYILLRICWWCVATPAMGMARTGRAVVSRRLRSEEDEYEEDDAEEYEEEDEEEEAESEVAVKILGRRVESGAATEEEVDEEDGDEEEEEGEEEVDEAEEGEEAELEEEEEKPKKKGVRKRIKSALRIKAPKKSERQEVLESLDSAQNSDAYADYKLPSLNLLLESEQIHFEAHEKDVRRKARILEKTFRNFNFNVRVVEVETGPVIAQYEIELEAGLRLSKITGLADDLAIALRVPSVRIVAPIPGKNTVGVEVPNSERQMVRLREVMEADAAKSRKMKIPLFLGKDVAGAPMSVDLATLPHLLIAGRTGTGKSVCLNSIITSIIMTRRPDEVRMLMIDPKMVELGPYKKLPHLMHPVVTDMRKAEAILGWAVEKMEERYALLAQAGVRHVSVYNQLGDEELQERLAPESEEAWEATPRHLPYIVIIADEIADLMMTSGKEVEQHIIRLAQKSRAVGIHLVLATQKPTVDVITGLIKSNLPARIAFQVASRTDSRVVLDEMGADKLLGNGDMLFLWPGTSSLLRAQGTYLTDDEITSVVDSVASTEQQFVHELVQLKPAGAEEGGVEKFKNRDELYESAIEVVVREGRGSVSLLQRALGVGYGRGARLIDFMAEDGIVGPYNGSQAREVLLTAEQWAEMNGEEEESSPPTSLRSNRIKMAAATTEVEEEAEWNDLSAAAVTETVDEVEADAKVTDEADAEAEEDEYEEDELEEDEEEEDDELEDELEEEEVAEGEEDSGEEDAEEDDDDEYEYVYEDEDGNEIAEGELDEDEYEVDEDEEEEEEEDEAEVDEEEDEEAA